MLKRTIAAGAAGAAAIILTAGAALPAAAAPAAAAPAGDSSLEQGNTGVWDCAHEATTEPEDIIVYCGDANGGFTDIDWFVWTDDVAVGTANRFYNDCDPACYAGTFHKEPVWIVLHDPAHPRLSGPGDEQDSAQDAAQEVFSAVTAWDPAGIHTTPLPGFPWSEDSSFR